VLIGLAACTLVLAGPAAAQQKTFPITVSTGEQDYKADVPVCVPLSLHESLARAEYAAFHDKAGRLLFYGQLTAPGIATEAVKPSAKGLVRRDLHFILKQASGPSSSWQCRIDARPTVVPAISFSWQDAKGEHADLRTGRPVKDRSIRSLLRYMYKPYDNSTPEARDLTYKVFHHLLDPLDGRFVTNGGQTDRPADPKKLLYPHHRGLMYAFNRITYDTDKHADTWHAKPGDTHEEHVKFLDVEAGPALGRHRVLIDWHGPKNEVFAKEERELTVYDVPGGTLVEFVSRLKTADGTVILDGDPQHAGFQFRAANAVAEKTEKQTYFLRPDGKGKPNETRNWPANKDHVNLPWDAMCFVLDGKRYTVAYLNNPANPGEQRYSERAYGRIGCYFKYELTKENPLVVRYRVWLQEGEMTVPQVQALSAAFVDPPRVTVK
jgi:hypothetical protein